MIDLPYSLVIEATSDPDFFGFYSEELQGLTGTGHSVEDCLDRAKWAMKQHVEVLVEQGLPVPPRNPDPVVTIRNQRNGTQRSSSMARQPRQPGLCQGMLIINADDDEHLKDFEDYMP